MKVVHITYSDDGGAGAAAVRLHAGLLKTGIDSKMLVVKHVRNDVPSIFLAKEPGWIKAQRAAGVVVRPLRTKAQIVFRKMGDVMKKHEAYSLPWSDYRIEEHPIVLAADVIHLHWVGGLINYKTFFRKVKKPIIWTLHDMNPFLGGIHYEFDARLLITPEIQSLEKEIVSAKKKALDEVQSMIIISPSKWMMEKASTSALLNGFYHLYLPNGLDSESFKVRSKLPKKQPLVVGFAAESLSNPRKGYSILLDYLKSSNRDPGVKFVCAGNVSEENRCEGVDYIGRIKNEQGMAGFYQSLDAFIICSLEDNLPNVVVEALFCGVPILGFKRSGMVEMVVEGVNGFLSDETNVNGIDQLITKFKEASFDSEKISSTARQQYAVEKQVKDYLEKVVC